MWKTTKIIILNTIWDNDKENNSIEKSILKLKALLKKIYIKETLF